MRIVQLVQKPQRRGAEIFAFQLTEHLRRAQHEVRMIYLYPYGGANGLPVESTDVLLNGREDSVYEKLPGYNPALLRRLREFIEDFKPDIVQANGARTVKYAALVRRRSRRSWVLVYRNIGNPEDWIKGLLRRVFYKRWVMPRVDGIVGVSQTTLKRVLEFYKLPIPAVHIPRGVDASALIPRQNREETRRASSIPPDAPVLISIGSLTIEKRPDRFLRIVVKLKKDFPELQAWIIGDGPLRKELEAEAVSSNVTNAVHFLGIQRDVASYLNASDLLLLPSDTEGIPGVILEAGILGVPVVANSVGGVPECVLDGQTGILVDPRDEGTFAEVVMQLLHDSAKRKQMGAEARRWVANNFEIQQVASRYQDFYKRLLQNR